MKALFSIHEIHAAQTPGVAATKDMPAVAPKMQVVAPGTAFYANSEEDYDFFLKVGAARLATDAEADHLDATEVKAAAGKPKAASGKAKAAAPATGGDAGGAGGDESGLV